MEVDGLLCAYCLAPGVAVWIKILHTDDMMCDVLVKLAAPHTFGSVFYYYDELESLQNSKREIKNLHDPGPLGSAH